jgi:hypothetical protein
VIASLRALRQADGRLIASPGYHGTVSGIPFFATGGLAEPLRSENPTTIVQGDRVTHLVYDVSR